MCARAGCRLTLVGPCRAVDLFVNQLDEPRVVMPYEVRIELEARGRRRKRAWSDVLFLSVAQLERVLTLR